jgi:hypothetical protein
MPGLAGAQGRMPPQGQPQPQTQPTAVPASLSPIPQPDRRLTAAAQLMAGITPAPGDPVIDRFVALDAFRSHQAWMREQWAPVRARLSAMETWRDQNIRVPDARNRTMLYPFSGPDFLNAYALFPTHARYVFFSLERPGRLPELERLDAMQFGRLLAHLRYALSDIFERNYFITDYMTRQLTSPYVKGTVPVIAVMMALSGQRIASIEPLDPFPTLSREHAVPELRAGFERPRIPLRGVRIAFGARGAALRTLDYYSLDATDRELRWYPQFLDLVAAARPATVFLKSASYLLHDGQFSATRDTLMATADVVVQDDTGIPYRRLQDGGWAVKLYGVYTPPLKAMRYAAQPDLEAAYRSAITVPALDFPFGYHGRDGRSAMLVARRER